MPFLTYKITVKILEDNEFKLLRIVASTSIYSANVNFHDYRRINLCSLYKMRRKCKGEKHYMIHASLIYTQEKLSLFGWSESSEKDFPGLGRDGMAEFWEPSRARREYQVSPYNYFFTYFLSIPESSLH